MQTLKIFKIGGNVVDNPQILSKFLVISTECRETR